MGRKPLRKDGDKDKLITLPQITLDVIEVEAKANNTNSKQYIEKLCIDKAKKLAKQNES